MSVDHLHKNREARDFVVKFLYQSEIEKVYYFSPHRFEDMAQYFELRVDVVPRALEIARLCFEKMSEIDSLVNETSTHWQISRMGSLDRAIVRVGVCELLEGLTPFKVILNEAIELAKIYGTEKSASFVNGLLDALAKRLHAREPSR